MADDMCKERNKEGERERVEEQNIRMSLRRWLLEKG